MRVPPSCIAYLASLVLTMIPALAASQSQGDTGSCDAPINLPVPGPGLEPAVRIYRAEDLAHAKWEPPACSGWNIDAPTRLIVEMTGSFRFDGSLEDLIARVGAISNLRSIRYWSTTASKWRPLFNDASALKSQSPSDHRVDFAAHELTRGTPLYYWVDDSRLGDIVYKVQEKTDGPSRAIILTENVNVIDPYFVRVFEPGDLHSMDVLSQISPGLWRIYSVSRIGRGSPLLAVASDRSFVNRASALFNYIANTPLPR